LLMLACLLAARLRSRKSLIHKTSLKASSSSMC